MQKDEDIKGLDDGIEKKYGFINILDTTGEKPVVYARFSKRILLYADKYDAQKHVCILGCPPLFSLCKDGVFRFESGDRDAFLSEDIDVPRITNKKMLEPGPNTYLPERQYLHYVADFLNQYGGMEYKVPDKISIKPLPVGALSFAELYGVESKYQFAKVLDDFFKIIPNGITKGLSPAAGLRKICHFWSPSLQIFANKACLLIFKRYDLVSAFELLGLNPNVDVEIIMERIKKHDIIEKIEKNRVDVHGKGSEEADD
jgi:hypothetical protein